MNCVDFMYGIIMLLEIVWLLIIYVCCYVFYYEYQYFKFYNLYFINNDLNVYLYCYGYGRIINILLYVSMWFFFCFVNVFVFFLGYNINIFMLFIMYYVLCIYVLYVLCDFFISRVVGLVVCF